MRMIKRLYANGGPGKTMGLIMRQCIKDSLGETPVGLIKRLRVKDSSGETLVEIMVSGLLFLMLMAVMQGAITFCSNAQQKSGQLRQTNAEICNKLRSTENTPGTSAGSASLTFQAVSADGTHVGNTVFTIDVTLEKRQVAAADGKTADFYSYAAGGVGP